MNYQNVYTRLIERRVHSTQMLQVFQKHHIVPKCLGGGDTEDNIVKLTYREHYIAHLLLYKIHRNNKQVAYKLLNAIMIMGSTLGTSNKIRFNSRMYDLLVRKFIDSKTVKILINGQYKSFNEISAEFNIPKQTLWTRYYKGYRDQKLLKPSKRIGQTIVSDDGLSFSDWIKQNNIDSSYARHIFRDMLNKGYSINDILKYILDENKNKTTVTINGKLISLQSLSKMYGIGVETLRWRLNNGWHVDDIVQPISPQVYHYNGKSLTLSEWSKKLGVNRKTLASRLYRNLPYEKVFKK